MDGRHVTKPIASFCPLSEVIATITFTLTGTPATLEGVGFTAEQVAQGGSCMIEPHAANAWVKFDGNAPADSDGHRIGQNELRQLDQPHISNLQIIGSGAATFTLLRFLE